MNHGSKGENRPLVPRSPLPLPVPLPLSPLPLSPINPSKEKTGNMLKSNNINNDSFPSSSSVISDGRNENKRNKNKNKMGNQIDIEKEGVYDNNNHINNNNNISTIKSINNNTNNNKINNDNTTTLNQQLHLMNNKLENDKQLRALEADINTVVSEKDRENFDVVMRMMGDIERSQIETEVSSIINVLRLFVYLSCFY